MPISLPSRLSTLHWEKNWGAGLLASVLSWLKMDSVAKKTRLWSVDEYFKLRETVDKGIRVLTFDNL